MLNKLKEMFRKGNDNEITILSPIEGQACDITEVNDPTFSGKLLGDGIAIRPDKGRMVSPVSGTIAIFFDTKHACTIISDEGAEILIHIGLDTVNLKGKYYTSYKKEGDKVKPGDLLLEFNMEGIKEAGYDLISPIVICNSGNYSEIKTHTGNKVKELEPIIQIMQ